jgi:ABC-type lipoprotein export system ATPase subunit
METTGLGKRYGKAWALRDCTLAVPEGCLAALVGPNGSGKSTLMNMAVGLTLPTAGTATVLDGQATGSPVALDDIAFMAQDAPVYKNMSVADLLHLTKNLNRRFDGPFARARLTDLGIPLKKKSGKLSGGQQAQVALTLALARRPRLLILDEPLSALDPLAPHPHKSRAGQRHKRRTGVRAVAGDAVGHLAAAPRRASQRPGRVRRGGGLHARHRAEDPPRRRGPDGLPSGGLGCLRAAEQLLQQHGLALRERHPRRAACRPGAARDVRRAAGTRQGTGEGHVPLRVDPGHRPSSPRRSSRRAASRTRLGR